MKLQFHGQDVAYDDSKEYGMYIHQTLTWAYGHVEAAPWVRRMEAVDARVIRPALERMLADLNMQLGWKEVPNNDFAPILRVIPEPQPLDEVRPNIENTKRLVESMLDALTAETKSGTGK